MYADPASKANIFNDYFASISSLPDPPVGFALPPMRYITNARIDTIIFTPVKVYSILKDLNITKANGPDQISNKMLRETAEVIAAPLSSIFNKSMETSSFPNVWKYANISPVFKKNNKQQNQKGSSSSHKEQFKKRKL